MSISRPANMAKYIGGGSAHIHYDDLPDQGFMKTTIPMIVQILSTIFKGFGQLPQGKQQPSTGAGKRTCLCSFLGAAREAALTINFASALVESGVIVAQSHGGRERSYRLIQIIEYSNVPLEPNLL